MDACTLISPKLCRSAPAADVAGVRASGGEQPLGEWMEYSDADLASYPSSCDEAVCESTVRADGIGSGVVACYELHPFLHAAEEFVRAS